MIRNSAVRWCYGLLALAGTALSLTPSAEANSLYWRRYSPAHVGPGPVFISPIGNIWNGGWWTSVDVGRSPLSICRISDGPSWLYGNYHDGLCAYYSPSRSGAHSVNIGFDLLGGNNFPRWRRLSDGHVHPLDLGYHSHDLLGDPTIGQQQGVLDAELAALCRIQQADGAFIGTILEGGCYAAWNGQTLVTADYEVIEQQSDEPTAR
ncbi:MAG: hypothetical protein RL189_2781 [Pseudomonadota bacterium]|jgi:hypothetical protein